MTRIALVTMFILISLSNAYSNAQVNKEDRLDIGVMVSPPFVMKDANGNFYGLSIDLWYKLAEELEQPYEFREYSDHLGMLRGLDFGEIDLAINPMTISGARLKIFNAGQPFFISSLGIASSRIYSSPVRMFFSNLFSLNFLKLIGMLLLIIFFFGLVIWIIERPHNQHQFRKGLVGILDGLWWSVVTMTTVGYGDKAPRTIMGRTISVAWMFVAIVIISSFTATITSTLTVNSLESRIEKIEDLKHVERIGIVTNSIAQEFLNRVEIKNSHNFDSPTEALEALLNHEIDVLVHDRSVIRYLTTEYRMDSEVRIMALNFHEQYRSFLAPKDSDILDKIDPQLVDHINSASWNQTLRKYHLEE
jgi:polar amino acid transport system substrate-binding protein